MCSDSLNQNLTCPLNPLIALGLFLSNRCLSILDSPYASDATIQYLYILTLHYHQIDSQNIATLPVRLIDTQITEYDRLITLASTLEQPELVEAISEAKSRICTTKRKYADLLANEASANDDKEENDDFLGAETSEASASNTVAVVERATNENYEAAMSFVAKFKQERAEQGKRMDWKACLKEGKDILKYKNIHSLRNQFNKYIKRTGKN
ncbi:hypothetical protein G6F43_012122 [Rhizopus delemar]|nr:hypothetical protein G6F43_012122 [Rhizopus delemar]